MKQSKAAFHKGIRPCIRRVWSRLSAGIRRVWSRLSAGSGTSRPGDNRALRLISVYFVWSARAVNAGKKCCYCITTLDSCTNVFGLRIDTYAYYSNDASKTNAELWVAVHEYMGVLQEVYYVAYKSAVFNMTWIRVLFSVLRDIKSIISGSILMSDTRKHVKWTVDNGM